MIQPELILGSSFGSAVFPVPMLCRVQDGCSLGFDLTLFVSTRFGLVDAPAFRVRFACDRDDHRNRTGGLHRCHQLLSCPTAGACSILRCLSLRLKHGGHTGARSSLGLLANMLNLGLVVASL